MPSAPSATSRRLPASNCIKPDQKQRRRGSGRAFFFASAPQVPLQDERTKLPTSGMIQLPNGAARPRMETI
jgi:hypothetical protein